MNMFKSYAIVLSLPLLACTNSLHFTKQKLLRLNFPAHFIKNWQLNYIKYTLHLDIHLMYSILFWPLFFNIFDIRKENWLIKKQMAIWISQYRHKLLLKNVIYKKLSLLCGGQQECLLLFWKTRNLNMVDFWSVIFFSKITLAKLNGLFMWRCWRYLTTYYLTNVIISRQDFSQIDMK